MKNTLFTNAHIALFRDTGRWRFVASALPAEAPAAPSRAHKAWASRHTHAHSHREILFALSGKGFQSHCGQSFPVREGTVFLFDAHEPHDFQYPPNHPPVTHLWFYFMHRECGVSMRRIVKGRRGLRNVWQRWLPLADLGFASPNPLFPEKGGVISERATRDRCAAGLGLLLQSLVERGFRPPPEPEEEAGFQASIVQTMVKHIEETHGRDCCLDSLARVAGYSKYHFSRLFQEHAGMSLRECVNQARAQAFARMRREGIPFKNIAEDLGFAHPSALCRWRRQQGL